MKKSSVYLGGVVGLLAFGLMACGSPKNPVNPGEDDTNPALQINVPDGFNFGTTKGVSFNVGANQLTSNHVIVSVYDNNPTLGGKRLQRFNVEGGSSQTTLLTLPSYMDKVWIEAMDSDGYLQSHQVNINGTSASLMLVSASAEGTPLLASSETCNVGCDAFVVNGAVTIDGNQIHCVAQGDIWSGNIIFDTDGGEFRTCGASTFTSGMSFVNNPTNVEVYVTDTGSLTSTGHFNFLTYTATVTNFGTMNFDGNLLGDAFTFTNNGDATFSGGTVRVEENSTLINTGTFTANGTNFQQRGTVVNSGTIDVTNNYVISTPSFDLDNQCTINVGGNFTTSNHPNSIENSGFIDVSGFMSLRPLNTFNVGNNSYVRADRYEFRGTITGPIFGNYGRFDALDSNASSMIGTTTVSNRVDICDLGDMSISGTPTIDGSVTVCEAYIPPTPCVPQVGTLLIPDEYPGDPLRFYNNPFPAVGEYGTLMYEDLWPSFGDYDMNDLVMAYNMNLVTNLQNEVVDIQFDMIIRALGAAFDSGFGIEFPVMPNRVQEVTGTRYTKPGLVNIAANGVEMNQTNAVVIFWDDSGHVMRKWTNTVNPAQHVPEDRVAIVVTFDPPVPLADLGTVPFNPFIFIDDVRGKEVHLPGYEPTDLADHSLFETEDDTTDPLDNRFYLSQTGLNWAINVPILIPYPLETVNILNVYNKFQSWAESGGVIDTDWYMPFSGYRNIPLLYIGPDLTPPSPFGPPPIPGAPTPGN